MELLDFINASPTAFQAVSEMRARLLKNGATELFEEEKWALSYGKTYFVVRNDSALMAFTVPEGAADFRVYAAHSDSPAYKLKENPEMIAAGAYVKLNVEPYGGMIAASWLDRPLSVAGRVIVKRGDRFERIPVNIEKDLLVIPNLSVHMNRDLGAGVSYNPQTDLLPLYGGIEKRGTFMKLIAENAGVSEEEILGHDLFLYTREKGTLAGASGEFLVSPRLDDLECVFGGFSAFLQAPKKKHIALLSIFDNEEVGSSTRQGAASTFLKDTVSRMLEALPGEKRDAREMLPNSFMLSADNGHAVHPNHPEKCDPTNQPVLNGGVLLKYTASQRYTTDGLTGAMFKDLAKKAGVSYQTFFNRSDVRGGGTLGNISANQIAIPAADIGLAQLAMHAAVETAGTRDFDDLVKLAKAFFE